MKFANGMSFAAIAVFAVLTLVPTLPAQTQTLTVLHNFTGIPDGQAPTGGLLLDAAGNLYGVTMQGGAIGYGSVFKLDPNANESVLYSFAGPPDGNQPTAGLVQDAAGNLYGVTSYGGAYSNCLGCGTVFKVTPGGAETLLHSFGNGYADASLPVGRLVLDNSGNLFGATKYGGIRDGCYTIVNGKPVGYGCGTVFKLDASGTFSGVHSFGFPGGTAEGTWPNAGLVLDSAGNLFGTASSGGVTNCGSGPLAWFSGCGTVFKVDTSGQFSVLYSFQGGTAGPDGATPKSSLLLDAAGNLYGTTNVGGNAAPCFVGETCGTIFQVTPAGKESLLHSFGPADGAATPAAGLVQDAAGNFYGMASGNVFKLDSTGKESVLYAFGGSEVDLNDLVQDAEGNLYGVLPYGYGTSGKGAVFKLTTPPDFAVAAFKLTPATVNAGGSASSAVGLVAVSGFNDAVTLACSVSPQPAKAPQCSISTGTPATLTVTTSGPSARMTSSSGGSLPYALWLPLVGLVGIGNCFGAKQRKIKALLLSCVLLAGVVFQLACGGGSSSGGGNPGTPAGAYTITVTGTSSAATGSLVRPTTTTLTVQ